ncbi:MAG: hypothetical protein A2Y33_07865 [Spirochaetes bacterium GWF1_51_8]|nr:MAG: hypothetical protein A2Y33_07865 [Spirochaetes bacterium GWF1_51_8]
MPVVINILLFVFFKAAEVGAAYFLMQYFQLKTDIWVTAFYGGATLFQTAFYIYGTLAGNKTGGDIAVKRYSSTITYFMELIALGASMYYLFMLRNPYQSLQYIFVVGALIGNLYFAAHKTVLGSILKHTKITVHGTGLISTLIFLFFAFAVPIAYFAAKHFFYAQAFDILDFYLMGGALGVNWIVTIWLTVLRSRRARKTAISLHPIDVYIEKNHTVVNDDCEMGYIQTEIKELVSRLIREKETVTLYNNYISGQIREHTARYGIQMNGELKNATIATILYDIPKDIESAEEILRINNRIVGLIGEMAGDYDGYPYFYHNHAILVFGVPFYFEHQKYNAVECTTRVMGDIDTFAQSEGLNIPCTSGIYSGPLVFGAMNTPGKHLKEVRVVGESIDNSHKIAAISRNLKVRLLTDNLTIDNLRTKFYVQKTYKIKLENGEMILLNQVKA